VKRIKQGLSLQGYLLLNVVAILIPGLVFAAILFSRFYNSELARVDEDLQGKALELALTLDRDLQGQQYTLQALSVGQALANRNFEVFHRQASRVRAFTGIDVLLRDRSGQQLVNTRVPYGTVLPPPYPVDGDDEVVKTRQPYVTNLVIGGVVRRPVYAITVPVVENNEVVLFLHLSLELQRLIDIINADLTPQQTAGIFDRNYQVMARTRRFSELVGKHAPHGVIDAATKDRGIWRGTNAEGEIVRLGLARSKIAGWWVWVSIPEAAIQNSLRSTLLSLAAIGGGLTLFALLLAYLLARRFTTGIRALTGWAERLGRGEKIFAHALPVREFNEVGQELEAASAKRAELEAELVRRATRDSEERFQILVKGVTDYAIYMLDPEGHVTNWNAGAKRIKGYDEADIVGQHFSRFYTPDDLALNLPSLALAAAVEKGRYEAEGRRVRKDGTEFWANVIIDPIYDEDKKLIGFAKITRDITEKREAQKQLEIAREQLYQSQKMDAVGQLTGGVAHDFNNLLMIILGNLDRAKRTLENWKEGAEERLARAIDQATTGAQRAAKLTGHLLAFSRRQPLEPKIIDVNKMLSHLSGFLKTSLGEKVQLEVVGAAGLWQIEADPTHLETAILNLAVNARDAMPDGGKLTVEASNAFLDEDYCRAHTEVRPGQYVQIALTDTGTGMTKDVADRAFEPFFTTKQPGQGTGLGLSQVFGFVKQSGGHLKIYTEADHGTTVKVYLPRAFGEADIPGENRAPAPAAYGSETILLVEDDQDVRAFVAESLRDLNYRVVEAGDAQWALKLLDEEQRVDMLLTDVILPGENGRELADAARRKQPDIKVLFMTGYSRNAIVHQGRLDPGVDLIQKPVTQATLAMRVRELLDRA
jgi:PAS domain S-box-containing protein